MPLQTPSVFSTPSVFYIIVLAVTNTEVSIACFAKSISFSTSQLFEEKILVAPFIYLTCKLYQILFYFTFGSKTTYSSAIFKSGLWREPNLDWILRIMELEMKTAYHTKKCAVNKCECSTVWWKRRAIHQLFIFKEKTIKW